MKTAAILNFWDCGELLPYAVKNWFKCVDTVVIVFSDYSNYGEFINNTDFLDKLRDEVDGFHVVRCEPIQIPVMDNERRKRNVGIDYARHLGVTHFVLSDADEFYIDEQFKTELERFKDSNLKGLVCACQTYFARPTLTIGIDQNTQVSFIHKMTQEIRLTMNRSYPFAWEGSAIKMDPTRQYNINDGVEWSEIIMHHYSWVRQDYQKKIRNSTARANIQHQNICDEIVTAKEGYFCKFYQKTLTTVPNLFGIPDYGERIHEDLQQGDQSLEAASPKLKS